MENSERVKSYYAQWYRDNQSQRANYSRQWSQANPEKVKAKVNRYRTRKTKAGGSYTAHEWNALCEYYNNKCLRCGRDDAPLTFDHVIPVSKGGTSDISNGQPLCGSCNSVKGDRYIDYRPSPTGTG